MDSLFAGKKRKGEMSRLAVGVMVSMWVIPVLLLVNHIVPDPYMDEIFHIPQAQQYCRGNFKSWDPMITTPPGLYFLSLGHVASLFPGMFCTELVSSFSEICTAATLRSMNGVLAVICSLLVYEILTLSRPALSRRDAALHTIVLSLYPLNWFFTFLYYTDVASLTIVLAMYLTCLKQRFQFSALLAALAILIRQTNVVWMVFVACSGILNYILPSHCKGPTQPDDHFVSTSKIEGLVDKKSVNVGPLRNRKSDSSIDAANHSVSTSTSSQHLVPADISPSSSDPVRVVYHHQVDEKHHGHRFPSILDEVQIILLRLWLLKWEVLVSFGPFFVVLLAFFAFVRWNGSVVLGAKEAHTVSPHFAQIMYFGLASAMALAPFSFGFSQVVGLCRLLWSNKLLSFFQILSGLTTGFLFVHFFSIEHPYLVADNRHYTFYVWRKVIKSNWLTKYLLLPLYVYSWLFIFSILGKVRKNVWLVLFFLACAAVLIPTPLIEFRYYTIPFYFLILNCQINDSRGWFIMGFIYTAVNIYTMTMFLFRPFHWTHEHGTQRFIW